MRQRALSLTLSIIALGVSIQVQAADVAYPGPITATDNVFISGLAPAAFTSPIGTKIGGGVIRTTGAIYGATLYNNGKAVTDASGLTAGTLADARLSANVPKLASANVFTAAQTVGGTAPTTVAAGQVAVGGGVIRAAGAIYGATLYNNGRAVTDASGLTAGTLADARLSSNVPKLASANVFTVAQTVTGGLTVSDGSDPSNASSGQVKIGAGRLFSFPTNGPGLTIKDATSGGQQWEFYPGGYSTNGLAIFNRTSGNYPVEFLKTGETVHRGGTAPSSVSPGAVCIGGGGIAMSGQMMMTGALAGSNIIRFSNTDVGSHIYEIYPNLSSPGTFGIFDRTANRYSLLIDANGAVRTGGTIYATEVRVTATPFADYVFADGYKLRSLEEVEAAIKKDKHLPGIPSAAEIHKDGMPVSDMMVKQMEKIEELTLYSIQLKKQNDALQRRLEAIEKALGVSEVK